MLAFDVMVDALKSQEEVAVGEDHLLEKLKTEMRTMNLRIQTLLNPDVDLQLLRLEVDPAFV
jgi:hypothetical protein